MANTSQSSIHPDFFFPRTYDFGEAKQIDEFVQDFYRTALMSSLKKHVEYFWKNNRESLEFIDLEMQSVDPGMLPYYFSLNYYTHRDQLKTNQEINRKKISKCNLHWYDDKRAFMKGIR